MRQEVWQNIRDRISGDIAKGALTPGTQLPTEAELCHIFNTGRHSVRRAVSALAVEGKLRVEQGRGTFVESAPMLNYLIGRRTRFRQNLLSQGFEPGGEVIEEDIVPAPQRVAEALNLAEGAPVHRQLYRALAGGVPVNFGYSFRCARNFPDWPDLRRQGLSVTEIYRKYGIADYLRGSTSIHARRAREEEAELLHQHVDQSVLVVRKVDVDLDSQPIGYSESVWAANRVQFTIDGLGPAPASPGENGGGTHRHETEL
jgi:GntR family phosphonate transport system transcriptional regulator